MPKAEESFRDRRLREEAEEEEKKKDETELLNRQGIKKKLGSIEGGTEKVNELVQRAEPLIEQINNLYNQFISGAEKLPPTERRKQLEQTMVQLQYISKPTPAILFRCNTLEAHYLTYRDKWDKLMRDLEAGKIKRAISLTKMGNKI